MSAKSFPFLKGRFKSDLGDIVRAIDDVFPFLKGRFKSAHENEEHGHAYHVSIPQRKIQEEGSQETSVREWRVSIPQRKIQEILTPLPIVPVSNVSIPQRKIQESTTRLQAAPSRCVSIPQRKIQEKCGMGFARDFQSCFHSSKEDSRGLWEDP